MEGFTKQEIESLANKYPEAWFFLNVLRLERENRELSKKLQDKGPEPKTDKEQLTPNLSSFGLASSGICIILKSLFVPKPCRSPDLQGFLFIP